MGCLLGRKQTRIDHVRTDHVSLWFKHATQPEAGRHSRRYLSTACHPATVWAGYLFAGPQGDGSDSGKGSLNRKR